MLCWYFNLWRSASVSGNRCVGIKDAVSTAVGRATLATAVAAKAWQRVIEKTVACAKQGDRCRLWSRVRPGTRIFLKSLKKPHTTRCWVHSDLMMIPLLRIRRQIYTPSQIS